MDGTRTKKRPPAAKRVKAIGGSRAATKASLGPSNEGRAVSPLALPTLPGALIKGLNALRRRRGPVTVGVRGQDIHLGTAPSGAREGLSLIRFDTSHGAGTLSVPTDLMTAWLRKADPEADLDSMQPAHKALLLEAFLSDELDRLEAASPFTVELLEVVESVGDSDYPPLEIAWTGEGGGGNLYLDGEGLAEALATILDSAAGEASLAATRVPIPVRVVLGFAHIALNDLERLEPGDVVLLQGSGQPRSHCVIGAVKAAPVAAVDNGWRLTSGFTPLTGSEWNFDMATDRNNGLDDIEGAGSLSELPITLVFEAGRIAIPLDEVRRLDAGSIIPLDGPNEAVVTILASGKRVGRGELVRLGEGLGVRVVTIFAND